MEELIIAVQLLKQRDAWDYVAMFAPLVLSVVAIVVSLCTAHKQTQISKKQNEIAQRQNNIALFEPRYKVFHIVNFLFTVGQKIVNDSKKHNTDFDIWDNLANSMRAYKYVLSPFDKDIEYSQVEYFYSNLILEVGRLPCLFKDESTEQITNFLQTFNDLVLDVCNSSPYDENLKSLETSLIQIQEHQYLDELEKHLML